MITTWSLRILSVRSKYFSKFLCLSSGKIGDGHFSMPVCCRKVSPRRPVCKIQNTQFINCRVFFAFPPRVTFSPIVCGLIFSQAMSLICVGATLCSFFPLCFLRHCNILLTTRYSAVFYLLLDYLNM